MDRGERIGYIRVSTEEQNLARQEELMTRIGADKVFSEKVSGKDRNRPQLEAMLNYVREGDTVIVESISRLARSLKDFLNIMEELKEKNVKFESLKENIETTSATGEMMMGMFALLAQFERRTIRERQAEGIAIAKAEGRYRGRVRVEVDAEAFNAEYVRWKSGRTTPKLIMEKLGLKKGTFWRRVAEWEENCE
jgi:DNA invertase Pin-like site-specific DNA recombinase